MAVLKAGEEGGGVEVGSEERCPRERLRVGKVVITRVGGVRPSELLSMSACVICDEFREKLT